MIDRASGYVDPDADFQLEEVEDLDIDHQRLFTLVNHKQKNEQRPQLVWLVMSQWLKEQEAKLQRVNQWQQEQDKHLGQALK